MKEKLKALVPVVCLALVLSTASHTHAAVTQNVKLTLDVNNPLPAANYVDPVSGVLQTDLVAFDVKPSASSTLYSVTVAYTSNKTAPTGLSLYNASGQIGYQSVTSPSGSVTFSDIAPPSAGLSAGAVGVFTVKVDMPQNTANSTIVSAKVTSVTVTGDYGTVSSKNQAAPGLGQYFYQAVSKLAFSRAMVSAANNKDGSTANIAATFFLSVTPYPGGMQYPQKTDFVVVAKGMKGNSITIANKDVPVKYGNPATYLSPGSSYEIDLLANSGPLPSDTYTFYVTSASTTVQDSFGKLVHVTQTFGLKNFHTDPITVIGKAGANRSLIKNGMANIEQAFSDIVSAFKDIFGK